MYIQSGPKIKPSRFCHNCISLFYCSTLSSALEVIFNDMRYINLRFTYLPTLLTYLLLLNLQQRDY